MPFVKGQSGNPSGARTTRHGRRPDLFRVWCQGLATGSKVRRFRKAILNGDPVEEITIREDGKVIKALRTASIETRRRMIQDVDDRAWGKPSQEVAIPGLDAFFNKLHEKYK